MEGSMEDNDREDVVVGRLMRVERAFAAASAKFVRKVVASKEVVILRRYEDDTSTNGTS